MQRIGPRNRGLVSSHRDPRGLLQGQVSTGANDVLVLTGPSDRMIPFVAGETIRRVDIDAGEIIVDWDESYWE